MSRIQPRPLIGSNDNDYLWDEVVTEIIEDMDR